MVNKIKNLLGSIRFWIVSLGALVMVLESMAAGSFSLVSLLNVIEGWAVVVVGLGTIDGLVSKFGAALSAGKTQAPVAVEKGPPPMAV